MLERLFGRGCCVAATITRVGTFVAVGAVVDVAVAVGNGVFVFGMGVDVAFSGASVLDSLVNVVGVLLGVFVGGIVEVGFKVEVDVGSPAVTEGTF